MMPKPWKHFYNMENELLSTHEDSYCSMERNSVEGK